MTNVISLSIHGLNRAQKTRTTCARAFWLLTFLLTAAFLLVIIVVFMQAQNGLYDIQVIADGTYYPDITLANANYIRKSQLETLQQSSESANGIRKMRAVDGCENDEVGSYRTGQLLKTETDVYSIAECQESCFEHNPACEVYVFNEHSLTCSLKEADGNFQLLSNFPSDAGWLTDAKLDVHSGTCEPAKKCEVTVRPGEMIYDKDGFTLSTGTKIDVGAEIELYCVSYDDGVLGEDRATCQADGTWSKRFGKCTEFALYSGKCETPKKPEGTSIIEKASGLIADPFVAPGTRIDMYCDTYEGYDVVGETWARCKNNLDWSKVLGFCAKSSAECLLPELSEHTYFTDNQLQSGLTVENGTSVGIQCDPGYQVSGQEAVICKNGTWTNNFGSCALRHCTADEEVSNRDGEPIGAGIENVATQADCERLCRLSAVCREYAWHGSHAGQLANICALKLAGGPLYQLSDFPGLELFLDAYLQSQSGVCAVRGWWVKGLSALAGLWHECNHNQATVHIPVRSWYHKDKSNFT